MHDYMKALQRQFESTPRSIQELSDEIDRTHKELSSRLAKDDRKLLLKLVDMDQDPDTINKDGNCIEILEEGENGQPSRPGLMIDTGLTGWQKYTWTVTASCDFEGSVMVSNPLTALEFHLRASGAESTVLRPQSDREYAIRYYFDTAADRTGAWGGGVPSL